YGGGNSGLMGALSSSALKAGGNVTGIIPKKIHEQVEHIELSELHIVDTMHDRKNMMYSLADAFIALPGGIGTIEELAEIFTWQQIGYHQKPVAVWNINQFYNPFRDMMLHMV
ncbi:TIGR00730 family Rossman fold protein, partial [Pseudomonas sp. 2995-1]|uniref:TIGR00730 family Rossman fold protein n=1 Tax=Pseudomonas sp. 2995-1 TaxID=1712679 RepID=UPI000C15271B